MPNEFDQCGFQIGRWFHWLPESVEDEIERLKFNLAKYEIGITFGARYPQDINVARIADYERLRELGGTHKSIPTELYM